MRQILGASEEVAFEPDDRDDAGGPAPPLDLFRARRSGDEGIAGERHQRDEPGGYLGTD